MIGVICRFFDQWHLGLNENCFFHYARKRKISRNYVHLTICDIVLLKFMLCFRETFREDNLIFFKNSSCLAHLLHSCSYFREDFLGNKHYRNKRKRYYLLKFRKNLHYFNIQYFRKQFSQLCENAVAGVWKRALRRSD
jgi:hypothetical protein